MHAPSLAAAYCGLLIYCLLRPHAAATVDETVADGAWPCAVCWTLPATQSFVNLVDLLAPLWACPPCQRYIASPLCDYGGCPMGLQQCHGGAVDLEGSCYPCDSRPLRAKFRTYGSGLLASCLWHNLSVCDAGYYSPSGSDADDTELCVSCLPVATTCDDGFYTRRCLVDLSDACLPCALPQLPPSPSNSMRYGPGYLFPDCTEMGYDTNSQYLTFSECAFFLTPKWAAGYCDVYCQPGYAQTAPAASLWTLPTCVPCATACPPGFSPPLCPGGYAHGVQSPACQPCDAGWLPANASWVASTAGGLLCPWACAQGFYAKNGACAPCVAHACASGYYWLGCALNSPGECRSCDASACVAGHTFLSAPMYADTCQCAPCSRPVLGQTYARALCAPGNDTRLAACSVCAGSDQYLARACTLTLDTLCLPCTPPQAGRLLLRACNATADAAFGACPSGYACDGSYRVFNCTPPHVARDGLCVCPLATVEPLCAPRLCPQGLYPDPSSGGCSPCAARATPDSLALVTSRAGYVGFADACGCPPGYMRTLLLGAALTCWPCGDLACLDAAQTNSDDGFALADPACVCGVGPGMSLRPNTTLDQGCVLQCADGFTQQQGPPLPRAIGSSSYYGFVSGLGAPWPLAPSQLAPVCSGEIQTTAALDGGTDLLVLCADGTLAMHSPDLGGATFAPPLEALFSEPGIRASIRGADLTLHTQGAAQYAWFLFGFWGICGDELDKEDPATRVPRWCLAVELLSVVHSSTTQGGPLCGDQLCLYMGASQWGSLFPGYGLAGADGALAWAPSPLSPAGALFLLVAGTLYRYDIAFYADDDGQPRASDYPLPQVATALDAGPRLTFFIDALLLWPSPLQRVEGCVLQHASPCVLRDWATPVDDLRAAVSAGHLLLLQTGRAVYTLDPWNALLSPPRALPSVFTHGEHFFAWGALLPQALLALNGSHLWLLDGVAACPIDAFASSTSACAPMPCTRCGRARGSSYWIRSPGNTTCGCAPGFALTAGGLACAPCAAPQQCPGGDSPPAPCADPNAVTRVAQGTAADCVCVPGYFLLGGACLRCPRGLWCPFYGTLAPVACAAYGTTLTDGALSPLECMCPERTHHFACVPCDDRDICIQPVWPRPSLAAMQWAADPRACLPAGDDDNVVVYSTRGVSMLPEQAAWIAVLQPLSADALANVSACVGAPPLSVATAAVSYVQPDRCEGRHLEWDGATGCACVAGYESVDTALYGLRCLPCLNGTMRPSQSPGGCIPCLASAFQEAPYLGMTACACVRGYVADGVTGACVPVGSQTRAPDFVVTATDTNVLMYAGVGASAAALGFAALLGLLVMA